MLFNKTTGVMLANKVFLAQNFWTRLKGLQFRKSVPEDYACIILDCKSIHTCFMRFNLDVIFVDREWRVLRIHKSLKPFRFTKPLKNAYAAIELRSGHLQVEAGQTLTLIGHGSDLIK
ncbi:MAG: hypothetical protein HPY66_2217 [Firmicutes bacterium]|nr:hypothetical protein [Bacillota bacterium]MDI6705613.1 DUF192 domain-containing protein [Bacillota bacterium]